MRIQAILKWVVVMLMATSLGFAQTPVVETFDYPAGELDGLGAAENGWGGAWEVFEGPVENMFVIDGSLDYAGLNVSGNQLVGFSPQGIGCRAARFLETTWPDEAGKEYWLSFLMEIDNPGLVSNSWQGVSFWLNYGEVAYFGKNWGNDYWGIIGDLGSLNYPSSFSYFDGLAWLVAKVVMSGDGADEMAYLWVNPDPSIEPDVADMAVSGACTLLDNGFNQVVCHLGMTEGITCYYDEARVGTSFADVSPAFSRVNQQAGQLPGEFGLSQNYPNPFNPTTTLRFHLTKSEKVSLKICNLAGQEVANLANGFLSSGEYEVQWDASEQPSGIYLSSLQTSDYTETRKLILQK